MRILASAAAACDMAVAINYERANLKVSLPPGFARRKSSPCRVEELRASRRRFGRSRTGSGHDHHGLRGELCRTRGARLPHHRPLSAARRLVAACEALPGSSPCRSVELSTSGVVSLRARDFARDRSSRHVRQPRTQRFAAIRRRHARAFCDLCIDLFGGKELPRRGSQYIHGRPSCRTRFFSVGFFKAGQKLSSDFG